MFSSKKDDFALIFDMIVSMRHSLTMMFVFYSIDVIFLNEKKEIVEEKKSLKPFSMYTPKQKARYIIEMPCGFIDSFKLTIGSKINWSDKKLEKL